MTTMTTAQAATAAGVTPGTIRRWCRDGKLTATKTGRRWAINPTSLPKETTTLTYTIESRRVTFFGKSNFFVLDAAGVAVTSGFFTEDRAQAALAEILAGTRQPQPQEVPDPTSPNADDEGPYALVEDRFGGVIRHRDGSVSMRSSWGGGHDMQLWDNA